MVDEKVLEQRVNYRSSKSDHHDNVLACWRQHPAIHYWMKNLETARYSAGVNKNKLKVYVNLCEYDILALKHAILRGNLDFSKQGKMIGRSKRNDKEQEEMDLKFINRALEALKGGKELIYKSYIVYKDDPINCELFLSKKNKMNRSSKFPSYRSGSRSSKSPSYRSSSRSISSSSKSPSYRSSSRLIRSSSKSPSYRSSSSSSKFPSKLSSMSVSELPSKRKSKRSSKRSSISVSELPSKLSGISVREFPSKSKRKRSSKLSISPKKSTKRISKIKYLTEKFTSNNTPSKYIRKSTDRKKLTPLKEYPSELLSSDDMSGVFRISSD